MNGRVFWLLAKQDVLDRIGVAVVIRDVLIDLFREIPENEL